jgi:single-stranded-DNA-specific exonuclease
MSASGTGGEPSAFLNVERSLADRKWVLRSGDERLAMTLAQRFALPEVVARVMANRGVGLDEAEAYLSPTLRALLPDPNHLLDMDKAASRLAEAIRSGQAIGIFGDYDVDGATSSALLANVIHQAGGRAVIHIPDRLIDGYGPNIRGLCWLRDQGCSVVVTVDCGITAFDPLAQAADQGIEVVVIDHHAAEAALPRAVAVVNPNRVDETSPHRHLAAVGVAFLLAVAVNRNLKQSGWYGPDRREPDLLRQLDLVALGTVCDVVPLVGVNRALVAQGIKVLAGRANPGLAALADVAGISESPEAFHLGYVMGPRVNAGGRVGEAPLGARLLSAEDYDQAMESARKLDGYNRERQEMEAAMLLAAMEQVEGRPDDGLPLLAAQGTGWHPGIVGLIASRLKERYGRPAVAVAFDGDGPQAIGKGSGRSVPGLDLGAAIIAARQSGLLMAGGGHAMAAGFTVVRERYGEFLAFVAARLGEQLTGELVPILELDGTLDCAGATVDLIATLKQLGPYGAGNAEPKFAITNARLIKCDVVGQGHIRAIFAGAGGQRLKTMAFRAADSDLGLALMTARPGSTFHLAGTLRLDTWQGNTQVQMILDDVALGG